MATSKLTPFDGQLDDEQPASTLTPFTGQLDGEKPRTRGLFEAVNDNVIEFANAAAGGVSALANMVKPGNAVSGFIDENIIKAGEAKQSDVVQGAKRQLSEGLQSAQGIGDEVGAVGSYVLNNPLLAASQAAGSFALPGGAVKGAGAAAKALGAGAKGIETAGRVGGIAAGAAMAGGDAAGTAYDLASKAGATEDQAISAGRQASVIPALVGGVTGAFGAERLLAGAKGFGGNALSRGLKSGLSEAGQEALEEGVTQFEGQRAAMPYDATIDPTKGVAGAAAMGGIMGFGPGAVLGALGGGPELPSKQMGIDPNAGPLSRAAASAVDSQPTAGGMGFNPDAGATTVFPDGSQSMNSEMPQQSEIIGTSTAVVDGKTSTKINRRDGSVEIDGVQVVPPSQPLAAEKKPVQSAPVAPVSESIPLEQRSLDELRQAFRSAQDPAIRKTLAAEIRKRREAMPDPLAQPQQETSLEPQAVETQQDSEKEQKPSTDTGSTGVLQQPVEQATEQATKELGQPLTDTGTNMLGRGADPLQSIIQGQADARRAADELRGTTGASTVTGGDITPSGVESPVADVRSAGRNDDAGTAQPDANGVAGRAVGSTAQGSAALRPDNWRGNAIKAGKVARSLGLDPKGKRLKEIVAEIDAKDSEAEAPARRKKILDGMDGIIGSTRRANIEYVAEQLRDDIAAFSKIPFMDEAIADAKQKLADYEAIKDEAMSRDRRDQMQSIQRSMLLGARDELNAAVKNGEITQEQADDTVEQARATGNAAGAVDAIEAVLDAPKKALKANVQNTPQGTAGEAKAPSVKESKAEGGNAASNAGVPAAPGAGDVQADGVKEEAKKDAAPAANPKATELTPKQFHEAKLSFIAADSGADMAEVREMYDTEGGRAEHQREWLRDVEAAAKAGETLSRQTLDKLYELAPNARLPETAAPNGYQKPDARKAEAEEKQARIDNRKAAKESVNAAPAAQAERYEAGKALTKEQRKTVLASLVDVYKQKGADREMKGVDRNGNERFGYVHSPDLFEKSDITGAMVRYYVTLPDGRKAHPTELFPDYTQSDIDAEMAARESRKRDREADVRRATVPEQVFDTRAEANRWWNAKSAGSVSQISGNRTILPATERQALTKDGKIILVPKTASGELLEAFAEAGWKPAAQAEKPAEGATAPKKADEKIEDLGEKIGGARKDTAESTGKTGKKKSDDDRPAWMRRYQVSQVADVQGVPDAGRWVIRDKKNLDFMNQPKMATRETFDSQESAEAMLPVIAVGRNHRAVPMRDGKYEIWRDINDRKRVKIVDKTFDTRTEALEYMLANAVEIIEANTTFGEADLPKPPSTQRIGKDRRTGNVRGEDFRSVFGFRGVEFGNWNNQEERQEVMNEAYDGLLDLAEVMGIPPKAISMGGELALAFGARGNGLSGARAHYEPAKAVINLTKMNGAGALAHEWFHAMDHYFGRQDGKASKIWDIGKDGTRTLKASASFENDAVTSGFGYKSGVREEVRAAYKMLMETIYKKAQTYVEDTAKADKFVATIRGEVQSQLDSIRRDLAEQKDPRYYKTKNKPASAEQLAAFDTLAQQIMDGTAVETKYMSVPGSKSLTGGRWSNDALEAISAIYKTVRGRSGFDSTNQKGFMDRLRGTMSNYAQRLKMLADAQSGEEKTKKVPTDFAMDAKSLDQGRGTDYWTTAHEMGARAFQGYVEDKIAEMGGKSPFLNYGPENAGILTPWGWSRPYPAGQERIAINKAMDNLVKTIRTRETEDGNTEMYYGTNDAKRQGTPVDRAIMDMAGEGREANEILSFIAKSSKSPYRRQLAQKLLATGANPAVSLGGEMGGGAGFRFLAKYSRKNHEVTLSEAASDRAEQIFLHETTHAATLLALDKGGLIATQMKRLAANVYKDASPEMRKMYGLVLDKRTGEVNVGEFVAEAFTNPDFQKALKGMKADNGSLWDRLVNIVRRILGMEPRQQDALSKALELGAGVMRENIPLRAARSFRAEDGPAYAGDMKTLSAQELEDALDAITGDDLEDDQVFSKKYPDADDESLSYIKKLGANAVGSGGYHVYVRGDGVKEAGPHEFFFYDNNDEFIGLARLTKGKDQASINMIAFTEDARGSGFGKAFYKYLLDDVGVNVKSDKEITEGTAAMYKSLANDYAATLDADGRVVLAAKSFRAEDGPAFAGIDQTETPEFKRWFGDSKVVDANGKPMVVYHGSSADFNAFDPKRQVEGSYGKGFYFSDRSATSEKFGAVREFFVALQNPASMQDGLAVAFDAKKLQRKGFDGILIKNKLTGETTAVAFRPEQIKSATGNNGNFDPDDADISHFGIADAVEQIKAFDVKEAPKNTWAHYRGMALQALGRRQLVDLYGDEFGTHMHEYDTLVQQMDAEKNETGAEADDIAQRWGKLKDEKALAELMHDATLAKMDPDKPMPAGYSKAEYDKLKTRFNTLSPEAKTLYRQARDMYVAHYKAVQQAIKDRIERSEMSPSEKKRMMAQLDDKLFKELQGVYFPLARFGQYVIVVKDANGEVKNVTRAETVKEAEQARKELQKAFPAHMGNTVGKVLKQAEFNAGRDAVGKGFMADLMNALDEKGVDDELRDTVAQLYLSSLPDLSWAKHGIHRKGTPGFSQDARRAFAQNAFHGARYLAKLRYSDRLQDELTGMQEYVKAFEGVEEYDSIQGQQVVDEMVKRHEILMNPKSSPVSTALTSFGFLFHMGLSPASAMVNLTQTALVAFPQMGAKWGFTKAGAALTKASEEVVRAKNDLSKALKGDELAAFDRAVKDGTIDVTMAHDLAGIAQGEDQGVMWKVRPVMRWASAMFHHAEKFNRQATFLAAYRLSKETNQGRSEDWHYEEAKKATYDGHFDYSAANRARIMQGNWQRVILLFKQYSQSMIYTLARNAYQSVKAIDPKERTQARKTLGGILAAHAAAAGVLGLPIVGPLLTVASWIGGDDDEPWDAEVAMQNAMAEMIGPKAAEVVARGFSRLTPFDLSGRVALNKLILPDVQEGLEGKEWAESAMAAALGPVAGIGVNMARGAQKITEGDYLRGMEDMMPTALRGPLKALRYANEGAVDKTGIVITDEVGAAGVLGQASGFSPSQVRRDTERRSAIYAYDRALLERRSVLMRMMAEARIQGDTETQAEVQKDIQRFNEKNPTRRITPMNIAQSVRNRRKRIDEADQGVYLPSKRRDALDAVSF